MGLFSLTDGNMLVRRLKRKVLFCIYFKTCFGIRFMASNKRYPRIPQDMISPMPIVTIKYQIAPSKLYTYERINGIIRVFAIMGGIGARILCFRKIYVNIAPIRVARLPKRISRAIAPVKVFEIRHPMNSPGTAEGIMQGRTVSASEKRI